MRFTVLLSLLISISICSILSSCTKYEEGSNFSLRRTKMRIVGNWTLTDVRVNGNSVNFNQSTWEINKNRQYDAFYTDSSGDQYKEDGYWDLNKDKTIITTYPSDGNIVTYTIVKLTNKEMKLKYTNFASNEILLTYKSE